MVIMASTTSTSRLPNSLPLATTHSLNTTTCSFTSSFRSSSLGFKKLSFSTRNPGFRSCSTFKIRCGGIAEIKEEQFSDVVLKSDRPVLVEFVATWCGPCRLISPAMESLAEFVATLCGPCRFIGPAMESLAQEYKEKITVVKIDHDSSPKLIEKYKVYGLPTLILFKDGKEVPDSKREGAITKVKLKEYLEGLLKTVSIA